MKRRDFNKFVAAAIAGLAAASATGAAFAGDKQEKHVCKGKNSCKGNDGCKTGDNVCAGKNSCKGKGGCQSPLKK